MSGAMDYRKGQRVVLERIIDVGDVEVARYWREFIGRVGVVEVDPTYSDDFVEVRFDRENMLPATVNEIRPAVDKAQLLANLAGKAFVGVGEMSSDMRRDYGKVDGWARELAEETGVDYETPPYVRELLDRQEG